MPSAALLAAVLVLRGGTLLLDGTAVPDAVVVIRGDRIEAAGAGIEIPEGATILDAHGGFIVPGFIDNHVHVGRTGVDDAWAKSGVTTLIDNGSTVRTPGVPTCGRIFTAPGGYPFGSPGLELKNDSQIARYLDEAKPDCVKVAIERGFLADLDWPVLSLRQLRTIVAASHARRLLVRAHVTQAEELEMALDAGVDVLAHTPIERLPDSLLRKAAKKKMIFVSTAALWNDDKLSANVADNLARYLRLGGRIAIGSDYPNWPTPGLSMKELRLLAAAGITPAQILTALTTDGAAAASVSAGRKADVVVLAADPRVSVDAFAKVQIVIRNGEVLRSGVR